MVEMLKIDVNGRSWSLEGGFSVERNLFACANSLTLAHSQRQHLKQGSHV